MYLLRRLLPFLVSAISAALFFAYSSQLVTGDTAIGALIGVHLAMLSLAMLAMGAFHPVTTRLRFLSFPYAVAISAYTLLSFFERSSALLALSVIATAMLWIWYETLYTYWQQPAAYTPYTIQRISLPLYTVTVFMLYAAMSGAHMFLQMRLWAIMLVAGIVLAYVLCDIFSLSRFSAERTFISTLLGLMLGMELFAVVNAMPGHIYVNAIMMSTLFYAWVGITRLWAQQELTRALVMPYIVIASAGFFVTITSTLWII